MARLRRLIRLSLLAAMACAAHPVAHIERPASASALAPESKAVVRTLGDLLSHPPDLVVTVHPPSVARDPVYGPLFRRASELATAYAGPTNLGSTALAVIERTSEVVVAENDRGKEAVVVLRGVPADTDPLDVVDTAGRPLWRPAHGDVRTGTRELEPTEPSDSALFVEPGLVWIVASGPAIARTREALLGEVARGSFAGDETALASMSLPGDALPQLRRGGLAGVGAGLLHLKVELSPGGAGLVLCNLNYTDAAAAAEAEGTVTDVTLAFRHRLEAAVEAEAQHKKAPAPDGLSWLGAAKVDRTGATLVIRAPIPRPWLRALAKADVQAPQP